MRKNSITSLSLAFALVLSTTGFAIARDDGHRDPGASPTGTSHEATDLTPGYRTDAAGQAGIAKDDLDPNGTMNHALDRHSRADDSRQLHPTCTTTDGVVLRRSDDGFVDCMYKMKHAPVSEGSNSYTGS